jgi:hypothetical protein
MQFPAPLMSTIGEIGTFLNRAGRLVLLASCEGDAAGALALRMATGPAGPHFAASAAMTA